MKLSMWMIANRLEALEPEIHIKENARANLRSARKVYATNCVQVYQDGNDVVCAAEGDIIRLKHMEEKQAFEIIQSVFDFYDSWNEQIHFALLTGNCADLIEKCWQVFHNPIVLLDANRKVLAMSSQYSENELDEEWKYLCEYGYSSVSSIQYLQRYYSSAMYSDTAEPKMYRFPKEIARRDCLHCQIIYKGIVYGKFTVLEEEHRLNAGDVDMARYIVELLGPFLERMTPVEENSKKSVFLDMIQGNVVDDKSVDQQLRYLDWKRDHVFRVLSFTLQNSAEDEEMLLMAYGMISQNLGRTAVFTSESHVVVVLNENVLPRSRAVSLIEEIIKKNNLKMGESLSARGIQNLPYLYQQSLAALQYGQKFHPEQTSYHYYYYAVDYILGKIGVGGGQNDDIIYACHPDVVRFWKLDKKNQGNRLETLWAYLNNDRSLINTAQELYVHRSTLVYRIKKITDELTCDMTDAYTRDYMKISMRLLRIYGERKEDVDELFM